MFDLERDEPVKTVRINSSKSEQLSQSSEFLTSNKWNSSQSRCSHGSPANTDLQF